MPVTRQIRVSITVADLAGTAAFYREALGLEVGAEQALGDPAWNTLLGLDKGTAARAVDVKFGQHEIKLVAFDPPGAPPRQRARRTINGSSMWPSSPATSMRYGSGSSATSRA